MTSCGMGGNVLYGFSSHPRNINLLIYNAKSYADVLGKSGGSIPEFANPKYKDDAKPIFKKILILKVG